MHYRCNQTYSNNPALQRQRYSHSALSYAISSRHFLGRSPTCHHWCQCNSPFLRSRGLCQTRNRRTLLNRDSSPYYDHSDSLLEGQYMRCSQHIGPRCCIIYRLLWSGSFQPQVRGWPHRYSGESRSHISLCQKGSQQLFPLCSTRADTG